jgi:ABC-type transporter Mla MlaB component
MNSPPLLGLDVGRRRGEIAIELVIEGRIARTDINGLCERLRMLLLERTDATVVCDVGRVAQADAVVVDALARLQLTAQRSGRRVKLRDPCGELLDLLALAGLDEVMPAELRVQAVGQAEQGEPPGGVEEEADPADPSV